jgi:hypothetical protein
VERVRVAVVWALLLAGCGRIGFSPASGTGDADGGADDDTLSIDAPDFAPVTLVSDDFERTVLTSWGDAPVGGAWAEYNPDGALYSVNSGAGDVVGSVQPTYWDASTLPMARDVEVRATIVFDSRPSSGVYTVRLGARSSATSTSFLVRLFYNPDQTVDTILSRNVSGNESFITNTPAYFTGVVTDEPFGMSLRAVGETPTQLCAKYWRIADGEPSACTYTETDSTPQLEAPGQSLVAVFLDGLPSNTTVSIDSFRYFQVGPQ